MVPVFGAGTSQTPQAGSYWRSTCVLSSWRNPKGDHPRSHRDSSTNLGGSHTRWLSGASVSMMRVPRSIFASRALTAVALQRSRPGTAVCLSGFQMRQPGPLSGAAAKAMMTCGLHDAPAWPDPGVHRILAASGVLHQQAQMLAGLRADTHPATPARIGGVVFPFPR